MQSHKNDTTYKMGIDIGSTTVKVVLADEDNKIAFSRYRRHFSDGVFKIFVISLLR